MAANKKRKLDGNGDSTPPLKVMSAFAARQKLWGSSTASSAVEKGVNRPVEEDSQQGRSETPSSRGMVSRADAQSSDKAIADSVDIATGRPSAALSRLDSPSIIPVRQHSSIRPNKKNLQRKAGGHLLITTPEPERLLILGSYGVKVREGEATIAGAVLTPSDDVQWLHAPHCHALPILRTTDDTVLELHPHPAARGLRQLETLNPVFSNLWNESTSQGAPGRHKPAGTFQIIYTSEDAPKRAILQELVSPAEWNKKLSSLMGAKRTNTPAILLSGPKSSGKSTFGRLLTNRLLTHRGGSKAKTWPAVYVLDLDPGQPEFSPPGVVSLSKICIPNLSPPFCHPTLESTEGQLRAHAIASVTPALDPAHFIECALDLISYYRRSADAKCPLLINTPGWIQGTGLDILCDLITAILPTEVIYMSQDGPEETVASLQSACNSASTNPIPLSTLPSQPGDPASSRTPLSLRTMQTMSCFHQRPQRDSQTGGEWDPTPLTHVRPWRVRYSGPENKRGFLGLLCYDHQPAPELLAEAINGTVLALVKLESRAALRDLLLPLPSSSQGHNPQPPTTSAGEEDDAIVAPTSSSKVNVRAAAGHTHPLPLIPNPLGRILDPRHSRLLGLVLVRGVDVARGELQLVTPLPAEHIATVPGQELVLVAGRFDTPTWAYAEDLYSRRAAAKGQRKGLSGGGGDDDDEDEDGDGDGDEDEEGEGGKVVQERWSEVPWVEMLHGSQKKAVGSKVWRVRRDLGRG